MKVFSPAFQGTALPKDVKTVLPCKYSGEMLSPNRKADETVGGEGGLLLFPEDGPGILGASWALFQT